MRGGMWSGWAASRTGQLSDTESQLTFGGWQGGHHPRWQTYVATFRNHYTCHRGWSTHVTTRRYRQGQPNQLAIRISRNIRRPRHIRDASTAQAHSPRSPTPGTCKSSNHPNIETRGRAQRPAPTRRFHESTQFIKNKPLNAPRGGMLSGWAASRTVH